MSPGFWTLIVAVVLAVGFGLYRAATDGRFRGSHALRDAAAPAGGDADGNAGRVVVDFGGPLGERATLLQFSSAFCAPCRAARRTLGEVATVVPGVRHVEVDAESGLELVRRLGIMRTPTTVVLDAAGREVTRATGAPTKEQVLAALTLAESE
jgi:thiol-disulfide isomerase/thioredoxin